MQPWPPEGPNMADFWVLLLTFPISMRNIANGQKEKEEERKIAENSDPLTLLPVDHLNHKLCPTVTPTLVPIIVRHGEAFKFLARWT